MHTVNSHSDRRNTTTSNEPPTHFDDAWISYADSDLLVLNKPSGLAVLRDRSGAADLWSLAVERFGPLKLVHRIDKGTSGVLLVARNAALQAQLTKAFAERTVTKCYLARVRDSWPLAASGVIDLPLRKGRKSRYRVAGPRSSIQREQHRWRLASGDDRNSHDSQDAASQGADSTSADGVDALTRVRCVAKTASRSNLVLRPKTGRTHQLRVHLAWVGHPICGDTLYGSPAAPEQQADRLCLHARTLTVPGIGRFQAAEPAFWGESLSAAD